MELDRAAKYPAMMIGDNKRGAVARQILHIRSLRKDLFPADLFDEYAWNMLLVLFAGLTQNQVMSEAEMLQRAGVGHEAGNRWISHLIKDGPVQERISGADIVLTVRAVDCLRRYLDAVQAAKDGPIRDW